MITLNTDKVDELVDTGLKFVANDSGITLEIQLKENGNAKNISNLTAKIRFRFWDGYVGDENCTIIDATQGKIAYTMLGQQLHKGEVLAIVSLYQNNNRISTNKFSFWCEDDLSSDNSVTDSRVYSELENAIQEANNATQSAQEYGDYAKEQGDYAAEQVELYNDGLESHLSDPQAHAEIFQSERETFNPLYANALIGTKEGANITLDDANSGCPVYVTIYGKCTETLESPDAEKSPDNPATITGIGESGSVTVTVQNGEDEQEITIPLSAPLYGIKHPTTGEWLARDEIRVNDGSVQIVYNIVKYDVSGTETNTSSLSTTLSAFVPEVWNVLALNDLSEMCYAVISTHIKSNGVYNNGVNLGYQGDYMRHIKMDIPIIYTGITQDDSSEQRVTKLKAWFSSLYSSDTPLTCYYAANTPTVIDITDTEAGQALLALVSQNGAVYTNSENADMKVTYNRDINKALEDVLAAGAAAALESDYRLSKMELGLN